jgi:TolB-like protein
MSTQFARPEEDGRIPSSRSPLLRFGAFEFDIKNGDLRKEGSLVRLKPQPLKLLTLLVSQAGEVVGRNDIQERLWGPGTFIDFEQGVNHCVRQIRMALGDDAINPRYVQTLPRRGYRFLPAPQMSETEERRIHSSLKNVERPVLAVLPFENLSGECHEDHLGDGLTDELITQLGQTYPDALGVISRFSISRYRNGAKPAVEVGRELGADYIVEGSVRRSVDRVRICAQLVDAEHQTHLWAEPYERTLSDVLSLQCEVAQAIAHEILLVLRLKAQPAERSGWIANA